MTHASPSRPEPRQPEPPPPDPITGPAAVPGMLGAIHRRLRRGWRRRQVEQALRHPTRPDPGPDS